MVIKKITILAFSLFVSGMLHTAPLDIKVKEVQDKIIAGMPLFLEVEIRNTSSNSVEVPMLEGDNISASRTCKKFITKSNGERPSLKEFHFNVLLGDYILELSPMPTEILQPGESREIFFNYGETTTPGVLEFWIECEFYDDPKQYEQHYLTLDHKILSGKYVSNKLEIKVEYPTGVDKEIYDHYLKGKPLSILLGKSKDIQTILKEYPQSQYAPWLVCSSPNSIVSSCQKHNPEQHIEVNLKYKNWQRSDQAAINNIEEDKEWINIYSELVTYHNGHSCSLYFLLSAINRAIKIGDFETSCSLAKKILNQKPRYNFDIQVQQKACEYQSALMSHNLCN